MNCQIQRVILFILIMKKIFTFLVFSLSYSQLIVVNYDQTFVNSNINLYKNYDLILTDSLSLYIEKQSNNTDKIQLNENSSTYVLNTNYKKESNIYYNNFKEFIFCETFFSKRQFVIEDKISDNWILQNETKLIGNYLCKLAVKDFRGRKYYAWYTTDFVTLFGPWKFHGLNGLILQVYDEDRVFEINARKINIIDKNQNFSEYQNIIKKNLLLFEENNFITITDLKKIIDNNNEIILNNIRKQLPRGIELPTKTDKQCKDCGSLEIY